MWPAISASVGHHQGHPETGSAETACTPNLHKLKQIAIDEISIGKGHRYLTVVLDLETGAVVFVGEGKGSDALEPFWGRPNGAGPRRGGGY